VVLTVVAVVVLVSAVIIANASSPVPFVRETKAMESALRGDAPMSKGAMKPIAAAEVSALAAPGWAGEIKLGAEDTWEPSIAADPNAPYVYAMYNGFNRPKACKSCPPIPMLLRVSSDGGVTWGPETYPCPCPGVKQFQYDPVMRVANNGVVYATWMNKYDIVFSKSADRGATWTAPIEVSGQQWADKPWIGVSGNGVDVYIGWATSQDVWIASSHNSGASFGAAVKLNSDNNQYRYANGFEVLASGVAVMSASKYPSSSGQSTGAVEIEMWRTTNGGVSWGPAVVIEGGSANASFPAITGGASGDFRLHYADYRTGSWNTWYRTSTNGGQSWSADVDISDADSGATYKTAAGFASEYGDYGAIDITNTGKTVAVWGEGASFSAGPGGIWFNRTT
jgi:hypothetical protein